MKGDEGRGDEGKEIDKREGRRREERKKDCGQTKGDCRAPAGIRDEGFATPKAVDVPEYPFRLRS